MPTVAEVLRQSGFTDEQITQLDRQAVTAFEGVLTTAQQEREQAELARRSNAQFYDQSIAPALNRWDTEKANMEAELSFYRTQNQALRDSGFLPAEAPGYQPRNGQGRYVAGTPGGTPGSPTFNGGTGISMEEIDQRLGNGISNVGWAMQEYARLNPGQFLPDSFDQLAQEAHNQRMPFKDYVAKKYDFAAKRQEQEKQRQEAHDAKIRQEAETARDKMWSEKVGSNPDVRIGMDSRYSDAQRAVKAGTMPDPLTLNEEQRRSATRAAIRTDLSEHQQG